MCEKIDAFLPHCAAPHDAAAYVNLPLEYSKCSWGVRLFNNDDLSFCNMSYLLFCSFPRVCIFYLIKGHYFLIYKRIMTVLNIIAQHDLVQCRRPFMSKAFCVGHTHVRLHLRKNSHEFTEMLHLLH